MTHSIKIRINDSEKIDAKVKIKKERKVFGREEIEVDEIKLPTPIWIVK